MKLHNRMHDQESHWRGTQTQLIHGGMCSYGDGLTPIVCVCVYVQSLTSSAEVLHRHLTWRINKTRWIMGYRRLTKEPAEQEREWLLRSSTQKSEKHGAGFFSVAIRAKIICSFVCLSENSLSMQMYSVSSHLSQRNVWGQLMSNDSEHDINCAAKETDKTVID